MSGSATPDRVTFSGDGSGACEIVGRGSVDYAITAIASASIIHSGLTRPETSTSVEAG